MFRTFSAHATASFTLDIYAHSSEQMLMDIADRIQGYYNSLDVERGKVVRDMIRIKICRHSRNPETTMVSGFQIGGDGEIRTLDTLLGYTRFPIVRARPATRHLHILHYT